MKKNHLLVMITLLIISESQAQILKGLKEKVASKISNLDKKNTQKTQSQVDSAAEKSAEEVTIGSIEPQNINLGSNSLDLSVLPDAYVFQYLYKIRMQANGDNMDMDYYLAKTGKYFATSLNAKEGMPLITVNDFEKNLVVNYIDGQPFVIKMPKIKNAPEEDKQVPFKVTNLPNKNFLGHNCTGKQLEDDLSIITIYIASDLGANMYNPFESQATSLNKTTKIRPVKYDPGLLMYMTVVDKKSKNDKKDTITMECISFDEKQTVFKNR